MQMAPIKNKVDELLQAQRTVSSAYHRAVMLSVQRSCPGWIGSQFGMARGTRYEAGRYRVQTAFVPSRSFKTMQHMLHPLVRAFQLAKGGSCSSVEELRFALKSEGYSTEHLVGRSLTTQLKAIMERR